MHRTCAPSERLLTPHPFPSTAEALALRFGGAVVGRPERAIHAITPLDEAGHGSVSFWTDTRHKLDPNLEDAVILTTREFVDPNSKATFVIVDNPRKAFYELLRDYQEHHLGSPPSDPLHGTAASAKISRTAKLGSNVAVGEGAIIEDGVEIGPNTVIGPRTRVRRGARIKANVTIHEDSEIGEGCTIMPGVFIADHVRLGSRVFIGANSTVGDETFAVLRDGDGEYLPLPALGGVQIDDRARIGAGVTIERPVAPWNRTHIGRGTQVNKESLIGHGVEIGPNCVLHGGNRMAGNSSLGANVKLMGDVSIPQHIHVGDGATLLARAVPTKDVPPGVAYIGFPAGPVKDQFRDKVTTRREIKALKEQMAAQQRKIEELIRRQSPPNPDPQ